MGLITNSMGLETESAIQDTRDEDIINVAQAWEIAASRSPTPIDIVARTIVQRLNGFKLLQPAEADVLTVVVDEVDLALAAQLSRFIFESKFAAIQVLSLKKAPATLPHLPLQMREEGGLLIPKAGLTTKDFIRFTAADDAYGRYDDLVAELLEKI